MARYGTARLAVVGPGQLGLGLVWGGGRDFSPPSFFSLQQRQCDAPASPDRAPCVLHRTRCSVAASAVRLVSGGSNSALVLVAPSGAWQVRLGVGPWLHNPRSSSACQPHHFYSLLRGNTSDLETPARVLGSTMGSPAKSAEPAKPRPAWRCAPVGACQTHQALVWPRGLYIPKGASL